MSGDEDGEGEEEEAARDAAGLSSMMSGGRGRSAQCGGRPAAASGGLPAVTVVADPRASERAMNVFLAAVAPFSFSFSLSLSLLAVSDSLERKRLRGLRAAALTEVRRVLLSFFVLLFELLAGGDERLAASVANRGRAGSGPSFARPVPSDSDAGVGVDAGAAAAAEIKVVTEGATAVGGEGTGAAVVVALAVGCVVLSGFRDSAPSICVVEDLTVVAVAMAVAVAVIAVAAVCTTASPRPRGRARDLSLSLSMSPRLLLSLPPPLLLLLPSSIGTEMKIARLSACRTMREALSTAGSNDSSASLRPR